MTSQEITEEEQRKYFEIFSALNPVNGYLTGAQAKSVLENSRLSVNELEAIWDLADIDGDGNLDFEEFCIAMRLIFDTINGAYATIPTFLPEFLIPSSKAHLVVAREGLRQGIQLDRLNLQDTTESSLSDDFDWYISPQNKRKYEQVYRSSCDNHGQIKFDSLKELYSSLDISKEELERAWSLVNINFEPSIGQDQTLVFLHILNNRHNGVRIPRSIPPSLRASFSKNQINEIIQKYNQDDVTPSSKKMAFAEGYLARIEVNSKKNERTGQGTNFSSIKDTNWEIVRLQKQLAELEKQIADAERTNQDLENQLHDRSDSEKASRIIEQLEQTLESKQRQLDRLRSSSGNGAMNRDCTAVRNNLDELRNELDGLEEHLREKKAELKDLQSQLVK